jgi:exonuclease VII small subunit
MFDKSLDKILSGFSKTVTQLEEFIKARESECAAFDESIGALKERKAVSSSQKERAEHVKGNIEKIIG